MVRCKTEHMYISNEKPRQRRTIILRYVRAYILKRDVAKFHIIIATTRICVLYSSIYSMHLSKRSSQSLNSFRFIYVAADKATNEDTVVYTRAIRYQLRIMNTLPTEN